VYGSSIRRENTMSETTDERTPAPLPSDVMRPSDLPSGPEDDLPLHLRVLRAILEGQPDRIDHALSLAAEVYELETKNTAALLETYRSAS
jgi:hypothetical protein